MSDGAAPAKVRLTDGLGPALEDAAYDCMSALAGVETYDVKLRDHPEAWAAIEAFAAKVRAAERENYTTLLHAYHQACVDAANRANEIDRLHDRLRQIGDRANDASTGPAVPDVLWEIRGMAYDGL